MVFYKKVVSTFIYIFVLSTEMSSQESMCMSHYCPNFKPCNGTKHILCELYNKKIPSMCTKINMTTDVASRTLGIINAMRSNLAIGVETGKNGEEFPRAYGMKKLKWDQELATLAQLTVNQCDRIISYCAATDMFHDPIILINQVLIDGKFDKWNPKLTYSQIRSAYDAGLKKWYSTKNDVTPSEINNSRMKNGDWPPSITQYPYLYLVYGSLTHIGCGINGRLKDEGIKSTLMTMQIVCILSKKIGKKEELYNRIALTSSQFSGRCGCELPDTEDRDCLCDNKIKLRRQISEEESKSCKEERLEPTLVVLPIVNQEIAPQQYITDILKTPKYRRIMENGYLQSMFANVTKENSNTINIPKQRKLTEDILENKGLDVANLELKIRPQKNSFSSTILNPSHQYSNLNVDSKQTEQVTSEFEIIHLLSNLNQSINKIKLNAMEKRLIIDTLKTVSKRINGNRKATAKVLFSSPIESNHNLQNSEEVFVIPNRDIFNEDPEIKDTFERLDKRNNHKENLHAKADIVQNQNQAHISNEDNRRDNIHQYWPYDNAEINQRFSVIKPFQQSRELMRPTLPVYRYSYKKQNRKLLVK